MACGFLEIIAPELLMPGLFPPGTRSLLVFALVKPRPLATTLGLSDKMTCCVVVSFGLDPLLDTLPDSLSIGQQIEHSHLHHWVDTLLKLRCVPCQDLASRIITRRLKNGINDWKNSNFRVHFPSALISFSAKIHKRRLVSVTMTTVPNSSYSACWAIRRCVKMPVSPVNKAGSDFNSRMSIGWCYGCLVGFVGASSVGVGSS